jgi:hypothetical protein
MCLVSRKFPRFSPAARSHSHSGGFSGKGGVCSARSRRSQLPAGPPSCAQHLIDSAFQHSEGHRSTAAAMVMLDAFGDTTQRYSGSDGRSIGHVPTTYPLARAIPVGELEVVCCFQLRYQGVHSCRGYPGGFSSAPQYLISAFVLYDSIWCNRDLVRRAPGIAGTPIERDGIWGST